MVKRYRPFSCPLFLICLVFASTMLFGCGSADMSIDGQETAVEPTPILQATPTDFLPVEATPTPGNLPVYVDPALPSDLQEQAYTIHEIGGREVVFSDSREPAEVVIGLNPERPLSRWVYAVTAPFPELRDSVTAAGLRQWWQTDCAVENSNTGEEAQSETEQAEPSPTAANACVEESLLVSRDVYFLLVANWGAPGSRVKICDESCSLLQDAWTGGNRYSILPYEELEPRWKVLSLENESPLDYEFQAENYMLTFEFGLSGSAAFDEEIRTRLSWPQTNLDPDKRTVVVLTGVTALTRAIAWRMEAEGSLYPAEKIRDWMLSADFTHVSNEVSFFDECRYPDPEQRELRFCSSPAYFDLLLDVDVDLVELTGNHILDFGDEPFLYSLDLYDEAGMQAFGGGRSLEESRKPVLLSHNGNQIAFFGCNKAGPVSTWATEEEPGSNPCDDETFTILEQLQNSGYLTFFTYQWYEAYSSSPDSSQVTGFHRAVDAGADIVSGSQAHQPQGFEFYNGAFIHYGPGNLFFDQMWSQDTREEFVVVYIIYDGHHISTELKTAILEDFSQPRPMTLLERESFLEKMFAVSRWNHFTE
ncbi:MAG: CapA family protein [Anaerolineales bacterium]|nr:CapA family protein [Anaerolineales bacterium]